MLVCGTNKSATRASGTRPVTVCKPDTPKKLMDLLKFVTHNVNLANQQSSQLVLLKLLAVTLSVNAMSASITLIRMIMLSLMLTLTTGLL